MLAVACACEQPLVMVGVADHADASITRQPEPAIAPLVPAKPGRHSAASPCPVRPDIAEKIGELEEFQELLRFTATDERLVYAARTRAGAGAKITLQLVDNGKPPVVVDETTEPWRGGILADDDRAYWSPDGVRRAFYDSGRGAPTRIVEEAAFMIHRIAPADILVPTPAGGERILGDGPAAPALWLNVPDDDPTSWTVTNKHAYWLSSQALYRASFETLIPEAVLPGPFVGGISADERRVYWIEANTSGTKLRSLDGDNLESDPVTVGDLSTTLSPRSVRATHSAIFVLSDHSGQMELYRFDGKGKVATRSLTLPSPIELAFPPVLTACNIVYRSGRAFFRRPLI